MNQIISHTPSWVWMLLAGLVALGISQTRTRRIHLSRVLMLPLAMSGLSFYSTNAAFGSTPSVVISWATACVALMLIVSSRKTPSGATYDLAQKSFTVPGSWVPLFLILGIFFGRYFVAASLSMRPELAQDMAFSSALSLWFGVLSGIFAGRALRLWKLSKASEAANNSMIASSTSA